MKGVRRVGVHHEGRRRSRRVALGARVGQCGLHLLYRVVPDARVGSTVQAQHRRLELPRQIDRVARRQRRRLAHQAPVPRHARLHPGVVRAVQPGLAPAPAKARHPQLAVIAAVGRGPGHGGVQVGQHLRIGHFGNHLADQLADLGVALGITLANKQLWRYRQIALVRQSPRRVGDVFVHAEDLGQDQHHRQAGFAGRLRAVGGHLKTCDVDGHFARREPIGGCLDRCLRHDRQGRRRVARPQGQLHRPPARWHRASVQQGSSVRNMVGFEHRGDS